MTVWLIWLAANWLPLTILVLGIGALTFYWDRHPDEAERICDRIAGTR